MGGVRSNKTVVHNSLGSLHTVYNQALVPLLARVVWFSHRPGYKCMPLGPKYVILRMSTLYELAWFWNPKSSWVEWMWFGSHSSGYKCIKVENPNHGMTSFDNLVIALVLVFQIVTLEGWTEIMYWTMDTTTGWVVIWWTVNFRAR